MKPHTVTFQYRKNWLEPQECGPFRASCTPMLPDCEKSLQGHLDPSKAEIDSWKPSQTFKQKWNPVPNIGDENGPVQWQEGLPKQRCRRFGNEARFLKPKAATLEMECQRECEMNCSVFHLRAWKHSAPPHSNHESASAAPLSEQSAPCFDVLNAADQPTCRHCFRQNKRQHDSSCKSKLMSWTTWCNLWRCNAWKQSGFFATSGLDELGLFIEPLEDEPFNSLARAMARRLQRKLTICLNFGSSWKNEHWVALQFVL